MSVDVSASAATEPNPLRSEWTSPFAMPPFEAIAPRHFEPAFTSALASHEAEIDAIAQSAAPPTFANTIERAGASPAAMLDARRARLLQSDGQPYEPRAAGHRARDGAAPRQALDGHRPQCAPVRARRPDLRRARDSLGLDAEQLRVLERTHTSFVRSGANLDAEAKARIAAINAAPRHARHRSSPRTCSPTSRPTRWSSTARPISPACPTSCARRPRGRPTICGLRASTSSRCRARDRAVPAVLDAPRPSRSRPSRPGSERGENGGDHDNRADRRRDHRAARRARAAARLRDLRRLPPRRRHGQDAGRGARAARRGLGGRPSQARRRRARRCSQRMAAQRRRQHRDRALGLALLRGEGAQGRVRSRRGRDQALPAARPHDRGRLRHRRRGCSASPSPSAPTCRSYHPDVRTCEVTDTPTAARRRLPRRLLRAPLEALRRLDERLPRPAAGSTATSGRSSSTC